MFQFSVERKAFSGLPFNKRSHSKAKDGKPQTTLCNIHVINVSVKLHKLISMKIFQGTGEHEHVTEAYLHGVALCTANDVIEDRWHSK